MSNMFRALASFNYRVWAMGAIVSNVGTWMQRTAQDWLVLVHLTNHNAAAVGIVMSLQFGPQLVLLPLTGWVADRFDRRKVLLTTQALMGLLALLLGVMTIFDWVQLWHVYGFALALGCVTAFDAPARQTFVAELVDETHLSNAVALNSTSFNAARMIGPAVAGVLIAAIGTGWVFLANAVSFAAVILALSRLRLGEMRAAHPGKARKQGSLMDGFRYVRGRPDLRAILWMIFWLGTFGLNFPIFISTMSVTVFRANAGEYGVLSSVMAIGSVTGALLAARRASPDIRLLVTASGVFGAACMAAALMPSAWTFGVMLIVIGVAAQTMTTSTNSLVQLSSAPEIRGRVIAILLAIFLGGTPLGAPIVGWVADTLGPRWALGVAALSGWLAALVGVRHLRRARRLADSTEQAGRNIDGQAEHGEVEEEGEHGLGQGSATHAS